MSHYSFESDGAVRVDDSVPMDAVGDMHFSGGLAQINEHGGELIDLEHSCQDGLEPRDLHVDCREDLGVLSCIGCDKVEGRSGSVSMAGNTTLLTTP